MTYVLETELQGTLNLAVLFYAKRFPDIRPEFLSGQMVPGDPEIVTCEESVRQRHYGRLEGLLLALGLDPSDPGIACALHEDINLARLFLDRVGQAVGEYVD